MKALGITSTTILSLLLAVAATGWAQEQHEPEQKDRPAQHEQKKAQPEKSVKQAQKAPAQPKRDANPREKNAQQQPKNAQQQPKNAQQQPKNARPPEREAQQRTVQAQPEKQAKHADGNHIPDNRFKANFGQQHRFRVSQGDYRDHRFQYGGYSFAFVDAWPSNWLYTQDVYVIEIDGVYYLCNPMYPGVNLALSVTL
jgi:flagellar motor protein MotB